MAMQVPRVTLGIDVSKAWIDVCQHGIEKIERVENTRQAIDELLKRYPTAAIAVEATNTYHELLVERALRKGLNVYLINGYQLKHYANSLGQRMRTDAVDAQLLARFLDREIDALKPYKPRSRKQILIRKLLKRRALLVRQQVQLRQSFTGMAELRRSVDSALKEIEALTLMIEKRVKSLARELGWSDDLARLQSIPG